MEKRAQGYQCSLITASILLTAASIAVGICFFSPYWLQNIGLHPEKDGNKSYIVVDGKSGFEITQHYPHRGLWAQCGMECVWFWSSSYKLQNDLFTPLRWHIATQVMYFVAAVVMLASEIYARAQLCCGQKYKVVLSLAILVLVAALLQIASFATFGGGAYQSYKVVSDPRIIVSNYTNLGTAYWTTNNFAAFDPFIGWSFWVGVVGAFLSIVSGVFFLITYCGLALTCCPCCEE